VGTYDQSHGEQKGDDRGRGLRVGEGGDDHLAQCRCVDEENDHEQKDKYLTFRALDSDYWVVKALKDGQ
jgi:hypothetical protein